MAGQKWHFSAAVVFGYGFFVDEELAGVLFAPSSYVFCAAAAK